MWNKIRHIAMIAPSGPLAPERVAEGVALLEKQGKKVTVMPHVFTGAELPYLAADAAARAADLTTAWGDDSVDLIMAVRGGFGAAHILPLVDWPGLRRTRADLPLIGFSDITALHFAMLSTGAGVPVAAPMAGKLAAAWEDEFIREEWPAAFAPGPRELRALPGKKFEVLRGGHIQAKPLVGNLAVAASLAGTPYLPSGRNRLVVLEDLNEAPYRIDRYLTQLQQSGFFEGCAAIGFGGFLDCGEPEQLRRIFRRALDWTSGPVFMEAPFSHGLPVTVLHFDQEVWCDL